MAARRVPVKFIFDFHPDGTLSVKTHTKIRDTIYEPPVTLSKTLLTEIYGPNAQAYWDLAVQDINDGLVTEILGYYGGSKPETENKTLWDHLEDTPEREELEKWTLEKTVARIQMLEARVKKLEEQPQQVTYSNNVIHLTDEETKQHLKKVEQNIQAILDDPLVRMNIPDK